MKGYYDPMYGEIELDDLIVDLVTNCPELKRLRFIGMMNFKSLSMLPLTTITRLEHTIGLAYLTHLCVSLNPHLQPRRNDLLVAALYHDVNCGSFGHSVEWAINRYSSYNHEEKISWIRQTDTLESLRDKPIFLEQDGLHRHGYADKYGIDFRQVDELINGLTSFVINNRGIDLDNIDNVLRMAHYLGRPRARDLGLQLVTKLSVYPEKSTFVTDYEGIKLVDEWRGIRSDVYRKFIYSNEYMAFEYLVFQLIGEYAKVVEFDGIPNMFHHTDEHLLWWFYNEFNDHPTLRNIAKRLLLHELPFCHGILRTPSFHVKGQLEEANCLSSIAFSVTENLRTTSVGRHFSRKPVDLHLTTDDRKTSRAIPIFLETDGGTEPVVLGEDQRYLLIGVLSDNAHLGTDLDTRVLEVAAKVLRNQGVSNIEILAWDGDRSDSPQYALL